MASVFSFFFHAFNSPTDMTHCYAVGEASGPNQHRYVVAQTDNRYDHSGWSHVLHFFAFNEPHPGTTRFTVGKASNPDRQMIEIKDVDFNYDGWSHSTHFYAFQHPVPGTVRYVVGHAGGNLGAGPHRMAIKQCDSDYNACGWV
eukprot:TRINITY_DN2526_c0_g1_i2.p1 TRINITY_DN2526_c0_g1~~TRINITY_DN2526_c0_g1_i2.p1  ORF type:complete len:144 (-),score=17.77 TRINITY_DN2526_c0_g1_i2:566-997(-)